MDSCLRLIIVPLALIHQYYSYLKIQEECSNLQKQSELIKDGAFEFSQDARALKRENKWANRKLQIAGATVLTGGILFLIFKFIL